MARKRMLSPEFFSSAPVNRLPVPAMLTFAGLWCYADDFGRGEDDAALIKAAVWPRRRVHTEKKVAADLDAIAAERLICRYADAPDGVLHSHGTVTSLAVACGQPLIHIPSWDEHQKISHKTPSKLMPCPIHETKLHAAWLRERRKFPETLGNGSRPPPEAFRSGSRASPPRAGVEESLGRQEGRTPLRDRCLIDVSY